MTPEQVVKAAIPDASEGLVEHILWGRTPFPCGAITVKSLYQAASRWRRAGEHGKQLCDLCDRLATIGDLCETCRGALARHREQP